MTSSGVPRSLARTGEAAAPARSSRVVRHLGADDRSSTRVRIVDAMLRCLARQGLQKTTLDDVARESGLSRATLYRVFPGGREAVTAGVVETEVARLAAALGVVMGAADDLEDVLVAGMVEVASRLSGHQALCYLLEHEPGAVLTHLAFARMDDLLDHAAAFAAPFLARWLEPDEAARAAEWATRIVLSYLLNPAPGVELTEPDGARQLVSSFVLPGIQALRQDAQSSAGHRRAGNPGGGRSRATTPGAAPRGARQARQQASRSISTNHKTMEDAPT